MHARSVWRRDLAHLVELLQHLQRSARRVNQQGIDGDALSAEVGHQSLQREVAVHRPLLVKGLKLGPVEARERIVEPALGNGPVGELGVNRSVPSKR